MKQLAHQKADFIWNGEPECSFSKIKTFISKLQSCHIFIWRLKSKFLLTPASKVLVLFCFKKTPANSFLQPEAFASRSLSDTETRYSQTEREVLWYSRVNDLKITCMQFTVVTDHKPLLKLYSSSCSEPPTRIHRWSLRLREFDFKLEYEPGLNNLADILSRKPFFDRSKVNEAEHFVNYVVSNSIPKTLIFQ